MLFNKLGIAFTFSPNALRLLKIAHRLQKLFQSELIIIHAGEDSKEIREKIFAKIKEANLPDYSYEIIIREGEASKTISKICEEKNIDLLISGALEKESLLKYYLGSVARRLMHELPCSLLVIVNPENVSGSFQRFCVNVDYSPLNEAAVKKVYEFAKLENAKEFILVREFQIPGLAITIYDGGETDRAEKTRLEIQKEEEEKLKIFSEELNLTGLEVKRVCLYGKQGWELKQYATDSKSDMLVISSPPKKLKLFDKIFQHDIEFILNQLPCSLLIIRS